MAKDALGHGSDSRGGSTQRNWADAYAAAMRAHNNGAGAPHSAGIHALPDDSGKAGGPPPVKANKNDRYGFGTDAPRFRPNKNDRSGHGIG